MSESTVQPNAEFKYIRYHRLAEMLEVSESALRKWVAERKIPHYKLNGVVLFDPEEVQATILASKVSAR